MAREVYFDPDGQLWNPLFQENNPVISYQGPLSVSNSGLQMPYQNAQYAPGSMNISVQTNQTKSGTSFDESSLITGLNSSLYGGSYSHGHGFNRVESLVPISLSSTAQGPQFSVPTHQASVSPMKMFKNPRLETMQEELLLSNDPSQMALSQAIQLKCYNDRVIASRMLQEKQNPHQQENVSSSRSVNIQPCASVQPHQASNTVINAELAVRRLNSYVHYRRQRPPDNNILYWRLFVKHFYSPRVKRRTCFSKHAHAGSHINGDFVLKDTWKCKICGCTSGKGFVETFDVLPRMNQLYFNSVGVVDELLYLELSMEKRFPDGSLLVYFGKAVQECIYRHCRVVHEGDLRVFFTSQLKIMSWDFCVQHHEVLLPRRLITSQVNELKSAIRCQYDVDATGHNGVQEQDLTSNNKRVAAAARKLSTMVEQPLVSDLGLSKHFVRNLQAAELLNAMKDLMTCSLNNNTGPIETLKQYGRKSTAAKLETRHLESRSPMQQTSYPAKQREYPAHNVHRRLTVKTNHCQTHPAAQQMMPDMYPSPYQSIISSARSALGPPSARNRSDVEQFMLNDILAYMQREGTKQAQSENTEENESNLHGAKHKKRRLDGGQVNNELIMDQILGGKGENGKGFNSSCSSNSPRMFPDRDLFNKDMDEDFTSPAQTQMLSKNSDRRQ